MESTGTARPRLHLLDEVRGFCILLMVAYHAFYTVGMLFDVPAGQALFSFFAPVEPLFAGIFILLSGASCRLSRNNLKRGLILLAIACGVTVVLLVFMPEEIIWFGILHMLACSILLFCLCKPLFDRIPPVAGILVCAVLFLLLWWFPFNKGGYIGLPCFGLQWPAEWSACRWLAPLGIGAVYSSDYFPLIPWVFCFFAGTFAGCLLLRPELPAVFTNSHCRPLAVIGRWSLIIYLAHQPLIFGICSLISLLTN